VPTIRGDTNKRDSEASLPADHGEGDSQHKAIRSHRHGALELLLKRGADVNVRNISNVNRPHQASYDTDLQGDSPLHKAVRSQKLDIVESLLKGGADVNVQSKYNPTPLHEAAGSGYLDITQLLLSHGADINIIDLQGLSVAQGSTITKT
jgi:ankyrin repeat protein